MGVVCDMLINLVCYNKDKLRAVTMEYFDILERDYIYEGQTEGTIREEVEADTKYIMDNTWWIHNDVIIFTSSKHFWSSKAIDYALWLSIKLNAIVKGYVSDDGEIREWIDYYPSWGRDSNNLHKHFNSHAIKKHIREWMADNQPKHMYDYDWKKQYQSAVKWLFYQQNRIECLANKVMLITFGELLDICASNEIAVAPLDIDMVTWHRDYKLLLQGRDN